MGAGRHLPSVEQQGSLASGRRPHPPATSQDGTAPQFTRSPSMTDPKFQVL